MIRGDLLHRASFQHRLAEPDKVLDLVLQPNVRILDDNGLRILQVRPHDGLVAIPGVSLEDGEVLLFGASRKGWCCDRSDRSSSLRRAGSCVAMASSAPSKRLTKEILKTYMDALRARGVKPARDWDKELCAEPGRLKRLPPPPRCSAPLVINPVIYAVMSLSFSTLDALDDVVLTLALELREIPRPALFLAARAYMQYRRRSGRG